MPTIASRAQLSNNDHPVDTQRPFLPDHSMFLTRPAATVLQMPPYIHVYCASASGFGVHGLLKSVSYTSLQALVPRPLPLRCIVQVTVSHCRAVLGEVLCCVKRAGAYQVGIAFCSRHKPEISVGCVAVVKSLDEPFTFTRGNVLDVEGYRLSIFCKTMLAPGAWVRVEADGWIVLGLVKAVVATSMLACCVEIHFEAALPAALSVVPQRSKPPNAVPAGIFEPSFEQDDAALAGLRRGPE